MYNFCLLGSVFLGGEFRCPLPCVFFQTAGRTDLTGLAWLILASNMAAAPDQNETLRHVLVEGWKGENV